MRGIASVLIVLLLGLAGCSDRSVGQVTDMHITYPVGSSLAIEITPNDNAVAGKYYIVEVYYLEKGRCRTALGWTALEIVLAKPKNVYVPLSKGEAVTLFMEDTSKLREVFDVVIISDPIDIGMMKEMQELGVITIYQ